MRAWRASGHEKSDALSRHKHAIRKRLGMRIHRGTLDRGPCAECDARPALLLITDYRDPVGWRFACPRHHRAWQRTHGPAPVPERFASLPLP